VKYKGEDAACDVRRRKEGAFNGKRMEDVKKLSCTLKKVKSLGELGIS